MKITLKNINLKYFFQCIEDAVIFGSRLIHSRTKAKSIRKLKLIEHNNNDNENNNSNDVNNNRNNYFTKLNSFQKCISQIYFNKSTNFGQCQVNNLQVSQ